MYSLDNFKSVKLKVVKELFIQYIKQGKLIAHNDQLPSDNCL